MSIKIETRDGVAVVTINRPELRNCIDPDTHLAMAAMWQDLDRDDAVAAVVLTGAGDKAFCTGADIARFIPYLREKAKAEADPGHFCGMTRETPTRKPIIAAINGAAIGGGLELALASDIRIAAPGATFALPEVRLGALAGAGGVVRLPRVIPQSLAMDMLLTGRAIDSQTALSAGLISEITEAGAVVERAIAIGQAIAANGPIAVQLTRDVARRTQDMGLVNALELERAAFRRVLLTEDLDEGTAAFREKRKASFSRR